jgi:hypothetical protein
MKLMENNVTELFDPILHLFYGMVAVCCCI